MTNSSKSNWRTVAVTPATESERGLPKEIIIPAPLRFIYLAFISTLAFEAIDLGVDRAVSLSRLAGMLFFGVAIFNPRICFRRAPIVLWLFVSYLVILSLRGLYVPPEYHPEVRRLVSQQTQLVLLFWIAYNLFHEPRI